MTETDAVTVLRQSRSIVPVSAWLTESKPSCFKTRVFYYCCEKRHPCIKFGKFRHLLAYIGRFVFPMREPGRLYQNQESPGEIGRLERSASFLKEPKDFVKEIQGLLIKFLWHGGKSKIKYSALLKDQKEGGLKFPDLQIK